MLLGPGKRPAGGQRTCCWAASGRREGFKESAWQVVKGHAAGPPKGAGKGLRAAKGAGKRLRAA